MINQYMMVLLTEAGGWMDAWRNILFNIANGAFSLCASVFDLFFELTSIQLFGNGIIEKLFERLFLIIGIFMLFKLAINFVSYLINPDVMKDRERGIGKLIGRVIMMLVLLYVLMPLPSFNLWQHDAKKGGMTANERNALYRSNGLLFGALYDLQDRIIADGTLSTLILGENLKSPAIKDLNFGERTTLDIHLAFLSIAEVDKSCETVAANQKSVVQSQGDLAELINYTCEGETEDDELKNKYMYEYNGFTAFFVAIGTLIIVFLFCFDVVIRVLKLGILRLLSPIPAISYIDPKSSKDGMFANYMKMLSTTYLDLFLRLAIIYLVIYLIAAISNERIDLFANSATGGIAKAIVYISLLFFALQAPKFIQQSLGIKSKGTGLGFGAALLGGGLSGLISGATTGGVTGAIGGLVKGTSSANKNFWTAAGGGQSQGSAWKIGGTEGVRFGLNDDQAKHMGIVDRGLKNMHNKQMRKNLGVTGNDVKNQKAYADALAGDVNEARDLRKQLEDIINANATSGSTQKFDVTLRTADGQNIKFSNTDVYGNLLNPIDLQKKIQSIDSQIRILESNQGTAADMLKTMSTVQQNYTTYNPAPERQGHMYANYGQYRSTRSKRDVGSAYYKETAQDRAPDNASSKDTHARSNDYGGDNGPHNAR